MTTRWSNATDALRAEWTKVRTSPGTVWLLLAVIAATVGVSAATAGSVSCPSGGCVADPTKISLTGIQLGQAVIAILAVLAVGTEYSTAMIGITLTAMPRRTTVLAAKAVIVAALVTGAATVAVLGSLWTGGLILPGQGFTAAHGFAPVSLGQGPVLRAAVGSVLYLVLIALLSLGIGTAVRNSAAAIGVVLGLLFVFPIVTLAVTDPDWQRHFQQWGPTSAGLAIQATTHLDSLPISGWPGLGVLAIWAAVALVTGGILLRLRDA